jgi:hypothetical protein
MAPKAPKKVSQAHRFAKRRPAAASSKAVAPGIRPGRELKKPPAQKPKPLPKAKSVREKADEWKKAIANEAADDEDDDPARDKGKGEKFAKMKPSLPNFIQHMFDTTALEQPSPRDYRSKLINKLFVKRPNGRYELNVKDGMFTQAKETFERKFGKDQTKGMPKSIMKGQFFQNSEAAFQEAKATGEIFSTWDEGEEFWCYRAISVGKETGSMQRTGTSSDTAVTRDEMAIMNESIAALGWKFNFDQPKNKAILDKGEVPPALLKIMHQAEEAMKKLCKEVPWHSNGVGLVVQLLFVGLQHITLAITAAKPHLHITEHKFNFT